MMRRGEVLDKKLEKEEVGTGRNLGGSRVTENRRERSQSRWVLEGQVQEA